jgi:anthranilate synthase component 1
VTDARTVFLARAERGGVVPLAREIVLDADTAVAAYAKIARPPFGFLLESAVGGERWARFTFLGTEPREVWRYRGSSVERWTATDGWRVAGETRVPIGHLAERLRALTPVAVPGLPPFYGGAVGYLGYDLARTIERLPTPPADTLGLPDAVVMLADSLVVLDNLYGRAIAVYTKRRKPGWTTWPDDWELRIP